MSPPIDAKVKAQVNKLLAYMEQQRDQWLTRKQLLQRIEEQELSLPCKDLKRSLRIAREGKLLLVKKVGQNADGYKFNWQTSGVLTRE
jgi:hypothetical protein